MMPLAPHISLPAIGHMTATTASTVSDSFSTSMSSKPKLAFSIDSIVGRNNNQSTIDCQSNTDRLSPRATVKHKHKSNSSPVPSSGRSVTPQLNSHSMDVRSPKLSRQLSPINRNAANISPLSTPSPISMANGSATGPYIDPNRLSHPLGQQIHGNGQPNMGPSNPMSHQLMMAHHMSPIPQHYHQAVALYPWLIRANPFANRFHGMPFDGGLSSFLLPPFRKPKRIRTAFSPGQLLKLEQAFEKNHYVVGAERKQLASGLGLSETQVKVWFQNRRTKHKRQKQEDEEQDGSGSGGGGAGTSDKQTKSGVDSDVDDEEEDDEEDIDMEDTDDNELLINSDLKHHQLWYQSMQSQHHSTPVSLSATHPLSSASSSSTAKI